jgi:hypothetical protein
MSNAVFDYRYTKPNWKDRIKKVWNEHPMECIAIAALAITATAKLIDSLSAAQGRRAYARQVDYRVKSRK